MSCENHFVQELHKRGYRLTPQRELVLQTMHEIDHLATVEKIYQRAQATSATIDISTVYRTLGLLQTLGLVACVESEGGQRCYQLVGQPGPHIHLICQRCGAIIGVPLDAVRPWITMLEQQHDFFVDVSRFTVSGLCQTCASQDKETP